MYLSGESPSASGINRKIKQSHDTLQKALESIIWATAAIVEARDPYTAGHQQRVANISLVVANEMGLSEEDKQEIRMAAMVHDLGKVCIPSEILSKPGRLNNVEFSMIKMHPQAGYDILRMWTFRGLLPISYFSITRD